MIPDRSSRSAVHQGTGDVCILGGFADATDRPARRLQVDVPWWFWPFEVILADVVRWADWYDSLVWAGLQTRRQRAPVPRLATRPILGDLGGEVPCCRPPPEMAEILAQ